MNDVEHYNKLKEYHDCIVSGTIKEIEKGAKTILFTMPVGTGRTRVMKRIAEELDKKKSAKFLFMTGPKAMVEQINRVIGNSSISYRALSFSQFEKECDDCLKLYDYIMLINLYVSDRRKLTTMLADYNGVVISASSVPEGF